MSETIANYPLAAMTPALATLAAEASSGATTITTSAAAPTSLSEASFLILVGKELMLVTAGAAGTTWTVTRGVSRDGNTTTAAAHPAGSEIYHVWTLEGISRAQLPSAQGPTVYVSMQGNDTNAGLTWGTAFLTVQKAFERLEALAGGTGCVRVGVGEFIEKSLTRPNTASLIGEGPYLTKIVLKAAENANTLQDAKWGKPGEVGEGGLISDITLHGNRKNQTALQQYPETLAVSNGVKVKVGSTTTIVALNESSFGYSLSEFASEGYAWIGAQLVKYKGRNATELKEVEAVYSEFEVLSEMRIRPFVSGGHPLAIQSKRVTVRNVVVEEGCDSGLMIQGSGTNANEAYPYQCVLERIECTKNSGYGTEILSGPDGIVSNWVGQSNWRGGVFAGGVDWRWRGGHPATGTAAEAPSRASVVIAAHKQSFDWWFFDTFPHAAVLINTAAHNQPLDGISVQGESYIGSCLISNGSPMVQLYGHNGNAIQKLLIDIQAGNGGERGDTSRFSRGVAQYPITELVGEQNLAAPPGGKVQVLSTILIGPTSTISGALQVAAGGTLGYTGRTYAFATASASVASGATTIKTSTPLGKSLAEEGFTASGTATICTNSSSEAGVKAIRFKYGKLEGTEFKEVTGITETLPTGFGIAQCFLTGVTGGTGAAVADGTEVTQTGRGPSSVTGRGRILATGNLAPTEITSTAGAFRVEGLYNGYPNPYLGTGTIAEGGTGIEFTHHLGIEPKFVLIGCGAAYTFTKSATAIQVKLAAGAPAGGTPVTVQASATEG